MVVRNAGIAPIFLFRCVGKKEHVWSRMLKIVLENL